MLVDREYIILNIVLINVIFYYVIKYFFKCINVEENYIIILVILCS